MARGAAWRRDGRAQARLLSALALAGPTILAAVLCGYQITTRSLGFDEAASVTIASQHGGSLGHAIAHDGGNMSAYYAGLHLVVGALGDGPLAIRLPSAVAVTATVAVVCVLARRLLDSRAALLAGLLSAVSLPLVFWAQDARGYAPMVAFTAGSFLAFVVLVERAVERRPVRWALLAYVGCTSLALYCGLVAVLVVPAQLLTLVWARRALRPAAAALGATAVCCSPLAVLALDRGPGQLFWVPSPSLTGLKQALELLSSAGLQPSFHATSTTIVLMACTLAMLAVAGLAAAPALAERRPWATQAPVLALSWLLVPFVLALLESILWQPILVPRNLLVSVPAVALLLAWGLTHPRVPPPLAWSLLAGLLILRALQLAPSYGVSPEDWRGATGYVLARSRPTDCVAFYPSDGRMAFRYYLVAAHLELARAPAPVLPVAPWRALRPYVEDYASLSSGQVSALHTRCPRLWLVSSHEGQADGPARSRANSERYLELVAALGGSYAHSSAVTFGYASRIRVELLTA
ncbi:MAG: glycosyltransferase family 39 protein [Solirubrobacterales bacterium]|nr:glycosyltransferase family 39 protein [Solirubrobacterales bacterium]